MKAPINMMLFALSMSSSACRDKKERSAGSSYHEETKQRSIEKPRLVTKRDGSNPRAIVPIDGTGARLTSADYDMLKDRVGSLSDSDLHELLNQTSKDRYTLEHRPYFVVAISELASRNPKVAMSWFSPEEMQLGDSGFLAVARILGQSAPDTLQEWLQHNLARCSQQIQSQCLVMALTSLSAVDASSALAFYSSRNWGSVSNPDIINAIFLSYGMQAPRAADAAAADKFEGRDLDLARYNISNGAGRADPLFGIDIAKKIIDSDLRGAAISGKINILLESNPAEASAQLSALDLKELQVVLQSGMLNQNSLINKLSKSDPDLLCNLLSTLIVTNTNEGLFLKAMGTLSLGSPDKATALLQSLPEGETKTKMIGAQFDALATEDCARATEKAAALTEEKSKIEAFRSIGETIGERDLNTILAIADTLPESYKNVLMNAALPGIAARNPKEAATLMAEGKITAGGREKQGMLATLGESLSASDASYAQDWLQKLSPEDQPPAMWGIATEMAKSDIQGLATMLSSHPKDKNWESGVRVLIQNISDSDPKMAERWQEALSAAGYK